MKRILAMTALGVAALMPAWAAGSAETFLKHAMEGNLAEINAGKLAQARGSSQAVRDYGRMLEQDHMAANQQAVALAKKAGVAVPTQPNKDQQEMYKKLSQYKGAAFDRQFADAMADDHKKVIDMYEDEAKRQEDGQVQVMAQKLLPVLKQHLSVAQGIK